MLSNKDKKSPKTIYTSSSLLVEGAIIAGDLSAKSDIRIDGVLEGNLKCETKVVVGKNGKVIGNISCASILVEGKVDGNVEAKDKTHLLASSVILGGLCTNKLIIEDGAMFSSVAMMGKPMPVIDRQNTHTGEESSEKDDKSELPDTNEVKNSLSNDAPTNEKRNHKKQKN